MLLLSLLLYLAISPADPAPGPHAVGFLARWSLDPGRSWRTAFDDGATYGGTGAPRPVLVLCWYPARPCDRAPLRHGELFDLPSDDPALAPLSEALREFALDVLAEEALEVPRAELDDAHRAVWQALLDAPTLAVRDAPRAEGTFPLVVFHSGAVSSFEDDAWLCAWLASHGYVVLASAYPNGDGEDLATDGADASVADVRHLLRVARELPGVDARRLAVAGHSLGAQATLRYAASSGCAARALVLLDTTQDYVSLSMPLHRGLVDQVLPRAAHITQPALFAAGPEGIFQLADALVASDRTYLTLPGLDHDEYLSQGLQRLTALAALGDAEARAREPLVRQRYFELCEAVRAFLDAHLRDDPAAFDRLCTELATTPLADAPHAVRVPPGVRGPEPSAPDAETPPSPRQVFAVLLEQGPGAAADVLEAWHARAPAAPLFTSTMFAAACLSEVARTADADARASFYARLLALQPQALSFFRSFGGLLAEARPELALELTRTALLFEPRDQELLERAAALEARGR